MEVPWDNWEDHRTKGYTRRGRSFRLLHWHWLQQNNFVHNFGLSKIWVGLKKIIQLFHNNDNEKGQNFMR